jgi:tetratricopeptide (TPR) repeat protein
LHGDPARGLSLIERAYLEYPESRTRETEQELLGAYLQANRVNDARRMVMELAGHVREHPGDTPYLIDAAVAWGDHLYRNGDYRLAVDAFKMAVDASTAGGRAMQGKRADPAWAKFQQANALLHLGEYSESRALFEEIAGTSSQWSQEAGAKAKFARLEEQRRGLDGNLVGRS